MTADPPDEPIRVQLAHGLVAVLTLRTKPTPPAAFTADSPPPWDDPPHDGSDCPW